MNAVWIVVIVVAVVVVVAAVVMSRRRTTGPTPAEGEAGPGEPAPLGSARTEERPAEVEREPAKPPEGVRTPAPPAPERREAEAKAVPAAEREAPAAKEGAPAAKPEGAPPVEGPRVEKPSPAAAPEPEKPRLSEEEVRSRLETQLADSERMIGELKEATAGEEESDDGSALAGSVEIIEEGLEEVRSLAKRKQWSQARDKAEALHAQLALMLQTARREGSS